MVQGTPNSKNVLARRQVQGEVPLVVGRGPFSSPAPNDLHLALDDAFAGLGIDEPAINAGTRPPPLRLCGLLGLTDRNLGGRRLLGGRCNLSGRRNLSGIAPA
jgi:hypothetical protein